MVQAAFLWFRGGDVLVNALGEWLHDRPLAGESLRLPLDSKGAEQTFWLSAVEEAVDLPRDLKAVSLRSLLAGADCGEQALLSRAAQLRTWFVNHAYCSRCGSPCHRDAEELAATCVDCGFRQYPRLSPCIIVLVHRGERCLLARAPHFPPGRFSTLAGFVEAGETAEEAVAREVREEVGIEISRIRYQGSQSWPFPHALMLGFDAAYAGGELRPDGEEILAADWFHPRDFPDLPPAFAISRQLIDAFVASSSFGDRGLR